jgi:hypothetical protein
MARRTKSRLSLFAPALALFLLTACGRNPAVEQLDGMGTEELQSSSLSHVCDPEDRHHDSSKPTATLAEVLDGEVESVRVVALFRGWDSAEAAEADILAFLSVPDDTAYPSLIFDLDMPLDAVARLTYTDGSEGVFAVTYGKVCLTDPEGAAWYLLWEDRFPMP